MDQWRPLVPWSSPSFFLATPERLRPFLGNQAVSFNPGERFSQRLSASLRFSACCSHPVKEVPRAFYRTACCVAPIYCFNNVAVPLWSNAVASSPALAPCDCQQPLVISRYAAIGFLTWVYWPHRQTVLYEQHPKRSHKEVRGEGQVSLHYFHPQHLMFNTNKQMNNTTKIVLCSNLNLSFFLLLCLNQQWHGNYFFLCMKYDYGDRRER